ncbi:MAG: hypothetical protein WC943_11330 [Elusimicrobiota bacterium]|jgi:hypothetical protein
MILKIKSLAPVTLWLGLSSMAMPVLAQNDSIFPQGYCRDSAPIADQASLQAIRQVFPDDVKAVGNTLVPAVPLRELSRDAALSLMAESSKRLYGVADFLTDPEFRSECVYYLGAEALKAVHEVYDMDLGTPLGGVDQNNQPYSMLVMIVGQGKVGLLYDRERVTYFNKRARRTLSFRKNVYLDLSLSDDCGIKFLNRIRGLSVDTGFPYGWENIEAMRQTSGRVQSYVLGKWRSPTPVIPIAMRSAVNAEVMTAKAASFEEIALPATAVSLQADFSSLETLRRLTEARLPFKGF